MAAGDIKLAYGSSTSFSITLTNLAPSSIAGAGSAAIDNSSSKMLDALVTVKLTLQNSTLANDSAVYVYAYGSEDGTNYGGPHQGTDAAVANVTPLRLIGVQTPQASTSTQYLGPFPVAQAFGGIMPRKWGIAVRHFCSTANTATATGSNAATYSEVYATVATS